MMLYYQYSAKKLAKNFSKSTPILEPKLPTELVILTPVICHEHIRCHDQNVHFSSSLGRPMETSWRNTASRHRDNVHVYVFQITGVRIVSCRSADFNMFQMTYKYNSVSSEDFGSLKFPWKKVQHSESGWYAHDLRYMFVVTSSSPPWRLINFF